MLRIALAIFILSGVAAWGQTPTNDTPAAPQKVDRATAYYHFVLAHMYSEMAETSGFSSREYEAKANENYKLALKADPQTPDPRGLTLPFSQIYIPRPPASRQGR